MSTKRIIPCLDVKDGKTVKGIHFVDFRDAGDPAEMGVEYCRQGADELVFLDITATHEDRKTFLDAVKQIAKKISIPFTVGGGISEITDVERLIDVGVNKVSINSAALRRPSLIDEIAGKFGSGVCIVAIDATIVDNQWLCFLNGGRISTGKNLFDWAVEAEGRGAGEILFTSILHDGKKEGYPIDALALLTDKLQIPIIASGGAGKMEHFRDAFLYGKADAALAASVFHFGEIKIPILKQYLRDNHINVK